MARPRKVIDPNLATAPLTPQKRQYTRRTMPAGQAATATGCVVTQQNFDSISTQMLNNPTLWGRLKTQIAHSDLFAPDMVATILRDTKGRESLKNYVSTNQIIGTVLDATRTSGLSHGVGA